MDAIEIRPAFAKALLAKCHRAEQALALLIGNDKDEILCDAHEAMCEFLVLLGRVPPATTTGRNVTIESIVARYRDKRDN